MDRRKFLNACATGIATAVCHPSFGATSETSATDRIEFIRKSIAPLMDREGVPGLQVALIHDRSIAWTGAYGIANVETKVPVTEETVFETASLTKPVFASLVMKLLERGTLNLDTPLRDYAPPNFAADPQERLNTITTRHVLTHTSGLPNWHRGSRPVRMRMEPGERFSYSGMAFTYLQKVVEGLVGAPLDSALEDGLFTTLDLQTASLVWRKDYETRLAHGHLRTGKKIPHGKFTSANSASSLICNAGDYARFVIALLDPPASDPAIPQAETLKDVFKPQIEAADGVAWGLGWGLQTPDAEPLSFWHWGNNNSAYNAYVCAYPATGHGIVILTNSGNGLRLCRELVPACLGNDQPALRWKQVVQ